MAYDYVRFGSLLLLRGLAAMALLAGPGGCSEDPPVLPPGGACGDGNVSGEACDDGNQTDGDGCSSACVVEAGYQCTGAPSQCGKTGGTSHPPPPAAVPTAWTKRWPPANAVACAADSQNSIPAHSEVWSILVKDGAVFAGTVCGQIFQTKDAGSSWTDMTPASLATQISNISGTQFKLTVTDIVSSGSTLYASYFGGAGGVYKSTDGGATWTQFNNGLTAGGAKLVNHMRAIGNRLYLATFGGGVYTSDGQADWQAINTTADPLPSGCASFLNGYSLADDGTYLYYGGKCSGVFRTPLAQLPGTSAWKAFNAGLYANGGTYYEDAYGVYSDGTYVYVGLDDVGSYRTSSGGQSPAWQYINSSQGYTYGGSNQDASSGFIGGVYTPDGLVYANIGGVIYQGTRFGGLLMSASGTYPWTLVTGIGNSGGDSIYAIDYDSAHVYVGTATGFYVGQ